MTPAGQSSSHAIAAFRGGVSCRRDICGPIGLTLLGRTAGQPDATLTIAFSGLAPEGLPEVLEDARVEQVAPNSYRITSARREWVVSATAIHVHRDIATIFYRAVTPRVPRLTLRIFWRLVLALANNPTGKRLLLALRRR